MPAFDGWGYSFDPDHYLLELSTAILTDSSMLTAYVSAALKQAAFEWLKADKEWYAEIPQAPGVWATGKDKEACLMELQSVLEDWILLRIYEHKDLPTIDGIKLAVKTAA